MNKVTTSLIDILGPAAALMLIASAALTSSQVHAASPFDGSKNLTCSVTETFECQAGKKCMRGHAEHIGLPDFLKIDFKKKQILSTEESGKGEVTEISGMKRVESLLLVYGTDAYHSWSVVLHETGKMSLTLTAHQVGFVVFGACTPM